MAGYGQGSRGELPCVVAVDLGATSGRILRGYVVADTLRWEQVGRFANGPVVTEGGLRWDYAALYGHVVAGLRAAGAGRSVVSIGVDSWAADYGLLRDGHLRDQPFHYRDRRSARGVESVHAVLPFAELYTRNGLQFLPFTTVYQLAADHISGRLDGVDRMLLIPDLVVYQLTGVARAEFTNASTTGLLRPDHQWDTDLIRRLELPVGIFAPTVLPGEPIGSVTKDTAEALGYTTRVVAVASHDTASAVAATPLADDGAVYISCGTWALVGVEVSAPVISQAGREANFTNEGGVDGTTRFLRNVMGLWLLNESISTWRRRGAIGDLDTLLAQAAAVTGPITVFDVDDPEFTAPGDMPDRIARQCRARDLAVPDSAPAMVRSIVESLAAAFARTALRACALVGRRTNVIHMVGGGAKNALLCQATADRAGVPVLAGPSEATAIGNILLQARAAGALAGDLATLRAVVARSVTLTSFEPRVSADHAGRATPRTFGRPGRGSVG